MLAKLLGKCVHVLVAVNEINTTEDELAVERAMSEGMVVLLDSGAYRTAVENAKAKGLSHDEGLKVPLREIAGFENLMTRYVRLCKKWRKKLWGYIEMDLGGVEQKRETRSELVGMGLSPIPVYHPLNDGWDYFDELAGEHRRICLGNIVQASRYVRMRLLATIAIRRQQYPNLSWVHGLGLTANEWLGAYQLESCDSSTWLSGVRWGNVAESVCLRRGMPLSREFLYRRGDMDSWTRGWQLGGYMGEMLRYSWEPLYKQAKGLA
jgi:hypothetical protein